MYLLCIDEKVSQRNSSDGSAVIHSVRVNNVVTEHWMCCKWNIEPESRGLCAVSLVGMTDGKKARLQMKFPDCAHQIEACRSVIGIFLCVVSRRN